MDHDAHLDQSPHLTPSLKKNPKANLPDSSSGTRLLADSKALRDRDLPMTNILIMSRSKARIYESMQNEDLCARYQ
jgi:hypothetical protein